MTPRRAAQAMARRRKRAGLLAERRASLRPHYDFPGHGRRRLNVTLVLPKAKRPTSSTYIRLLSPMSLPGFGPVGLDIIDEKGIWVSPRTSVCVVQRTAFGSASVARRFLADARRVGSLVIVDSDDAFSSLDPDHPQYQQQAERASILESVMREADEVWLSTDDLLASHQIPSARVVRNTLDLRLWRSAGAPAAAPLGDPLRIVYMGTSTHDGDFAMVEPALDRLHATHPGQFRVSLVGIAKDLPDKPWMEILKRPANAYPQFVPWLVGRGPFDVGLSPLVDSAFNRAKSDIKCLDYLALGSLPVVSDVLPYRVDELDEHVHRVPNDPADWYDELSSLVTGRDDLRRDAPRRRAAAADYLVGSRSADLTARLLRERIEILRAGTSRHPHS